MDCTGLVSNPTYGGEGLWENAIPDAVWPAWVVSGEVVSLGCASGSKSGLLVVGALAAVVDGVFSAL